MSLYTLIFLGCLVLVFLLLPHLLTVTVILSDDISPLTWPVLYLQAFANASCIYLLVMGIVMQSYLETLLNFGLTRRQNTYALLLVSVLMAFAFALISSLVGVLLGEFDPLWGIQLFAANWMSYLLGWLIVIGYQYRRVLAAILSTAIGAALLFSFVPAVWQSGWLTLLLATSTSSPELTSMLTSGILLLVSLALMLAIIPLTSRIPIKV
jgi:hypothetical protein